MRLKGLDILRGIALLLVLFRHSNLSNSPLHFVGWLGVDLFFVLSGFLISGILFKELKTNGHVDIKRFLIRRGLKTYPMFYFFLISSILFRTLFEGKGCYPLKKNVAEALYVSNYFPPVFLHTWSLAVEEHFYLLLAFLSFFVMKIKLLEKRAGVITVLAALLVLSYALRYGVSAPNQAKWFFAFNASHLRADGIIVGVLISYLYHFTNFSKFIIRSQWLSLMVASIFIAPGFLFRGGSFDMNTWGLTCVNLGFGLLTLFSVNYQRSNALFGKPILQIISKSLVYIGVHSYSIYLWHLIFKPWLFNYFSDPVLASWVYIGVAIALGIIVSNVAEKPILLLRDRWQR